eukprot:Selendium_serpulae@DN5113_c0_g1_i1.p1
MDSASNDAQGQRDAATMSVSELLAAHGSVNEKCASAVSDRVHELLNPPRDLKKERRPHENAKRLKKAISAARQASIADQAGSSSDPSSAAQSQESQKPIIDKDDPEVQSRTVFIGNVPTSIRSGQQLLKKLDFPADDVESCRLRSVPVHEKFNSRVLAGMARGEFASGGYSSNAYVVFKKKHKRTSVGALLDKNGTELKSHTLRVQRMAEAGKFSKFDRKRTVFVGGLPYGCDEDQFRMFFSKKVPVMAVRLIRDKITHSSKGFGFILLGERGDVKTCIDTFHGAKFKDNVLSVTRALTLPEATKRMRRQDATKKKEERARGDNRHRRDPKYQQTKVYFIEKRQKQRAKLARGGGGKSKLPF